MQRGVHQLQLPTLRRHIVAYLLLVAPTKHKAISSSQKDHMMHISSHRIRACRPFRHQSTHLLAALNELDCHQLACGLEPTKLCHTKIAAAYIPDLCGV